MTSMERDRAHEHALRHPALIYRSLDEFVASTAPFVEAGVARTEPVFVAVGPTELDALRTEIDVDDRVRWVNTNEWAPEPAPRLHAFHRFVTDELRVRRTHIRLVGEPLWPVGPPEFSLEWARYESALNAVLAPFPVSLVCTYDASRLGAEVVANARRTHPLVSTNGAERPSADFEDPRSLLARWRPRLGRIPPAAARMPLSLDAGAARTFVVERARGAGVSARRSMDIALAASEILANASQHAGGPVSVRLWTSGGRFVCQTDDRGPGIADPLAGYRPPATEPADGRGLWLARQVVDLMQIDSSEMGTSVRLQVRTHTSRPRTGAVATR
jgi:anti-sigma regulatory factor (Ser/Thr protein kinase)